MKVKMLSQSFFGKLSVVLGFSIPMLAFLGFALDSSVPLYLAPIVIFAWIISGFAGLIQRDFSIVTIVSALTAIIVFFGVMSQPWIPDAFNFFLGR